MGHRGRLAALYSGAPMRPRFLAACGIVGQLVLTAGWLLGGALQPASYDLARQEISDLGALTAAHAWVWNAADSISGLLTALFAAGLFAAFGGQRRAQFGALLIGVVGIGDVLDGLLREDCPVSTSPACQALRDGPGLSWHHQVHDVESAIVAVAAAVAPFVLARAFARDESWRSAARWTRAAGMLIVVALGIYLVREGHAGAGVAQRVFAMTFATWAAALAIKLWHLATRPRAGVVATVG